MQSKRCVVKKTHTHTSPSTTTRVALKFLQQHRGIRLAVPVVVVGSKSDSLQFAILPCFSLPCALFISICEISFLWLPDAWRHGWLFLIPKPLKPPVAPMHLRPLALQEPVGKAVIGLLIHLAMQDARFHMVQYPIWSYMEHRSTYEAIRRVSQHCADVRQLIQMCRSTPHARATRAPKVSLYGGAQLCIDLQRAFDGVNRAKLFTRLHELQIREEIIQLLAYWHETTDYFVQHDTATTQIPIGRGVRQGCKAAPGLWNSFMVLLLHDLNVHIPLSWIQNCLTLYADDFHVGTSFTSMEDLCLFHHFIGILFLTMQSLDMSINPGKSVALIELRGPLSKAARSRFVRRDHNGDSLKINIPGGADIHIPICKSTKYLGVIISYGSFEDCSLKHRLKLMHVGFRRLQRWLTGKHSLHLSQRFQLWKTCIYPIFSYGLFATGMTQHGLKQAITQMTVMMRRVLHDHAYVTRRPNSTAFSRLNIPTPVQLLHGTAIALLRTLHNRKMNLLPHDLAHTIQWTHLPELVRQLTQLQEPPSLETPLHTLPEAWNQPFFQCAHCDFCTADVSAFRRHYTQVHALPMNRTQFVQPADFALDGLPTCKFCMTTFSTWRMFHTHIERGCQELLAGPRSQTVIPGRRGAALGTIDPKMQHHPSDAAARGLRLITEEELHHLKSLPFGERLLHIVQERDWTKVEQAQDVCRYLATRCVICSHQFSRCQELHQHYRLQHPVLWEHVPPKAIQLTSLFCTDSPCPCCGALFTTHSCPTWSQIAVLLVNGAGMEPTEDTATTEARQRCELCVLCFPSTADLVQHLQAEHGLQGLSFNGSRDSLDNSSACAHCGQLFLTMAGLKSHIVQGRCQFFNPQASAETKPVEGQWIEACFDGKMHQVLQSAATRLRLTVVCQACNKGCKRAADLALHLQTSHARLWRESKRLTMVLTAVFSSQCFCNPQLGTKRGHHVCLPLRQLAMSFHRVHREPFAPLLITDTMLQAILSAKLPRAPKYRLEQALVHRQFADTWRDQELLQFLRTHCLFCGHQTHTSDLALHLREEHACSHNTCLFYMEQLLPTVHALNPDDYQCQLCGLIFNLPAHMGPDQPAHDRIILALSHLKGSCPTLLQLALLFGALLHGNPLQHGDGGHWHHRSDAGGFWSHHAHAGQESQPDAQSETLQGPSKRRHRPRGRGSTGHSTAGDQAHDADDAADGPNGGQTRPRMEQLAQNRSIHSFFEPRSTGRIASTGSGDCPMETANGEPIEVPDETPATAPHPDLAAGSSNQCGQDCGEQRGGPPAPNVSAERADLGRQEFSISPLGCPHPEVDDRQEATSKFSEDVPAPDGNGPGPRPGGPFPRLEGGVGQGPQSSTLETANQPPEQQSLRAIASTMPQCSVDGSGSSTQTPLTGTIHNGHQFASHAVQTEGQGQRQTPGQALSQGQPIRLSWLPLCCTMSVV